MPPRGYKLSEESKRRISESQKGLVKRSEEFKRNVGLFWKGKPKSTEHKIKIGLGNKGKIHTEEQNNKQSIRLKGKKLSDNHIQKLRCVFGGKNNPAWKGGITPLTKQIRRCFKNRQWRCDVFTRDDYTCVLCGKRGGYIEADHYPKSFSVILHENKIKSLADAITCEEFWNINNGRTLCNVCHNKTKLGRRKNGRT